MKVFDIILGRFAAGIIQAQSAGLIDNPFRRNSGCKFYAAAGNGAGPLNTLLMYMLLLYRNAFRYFNMGYASAMAWILFVVILGATLLVFRFGEGRVHYEAGN